MKTFYVVHKGRVPGIYSTWDICKKHVANFEGAIFKKFTNETDAKTFLINGFGDKKPKIVTRRENDDKKNNNKIEDEINDTNDKILIYTDGSCIKFKNNISKGGYGIYIPEKNVKVGAPLLNQKITNNRAELTAIIESIKYLDEEDYIKRICIFTDSQYSMYIFNGTGERYETNGFKNEGKDVPNIDLIKNILELKRKYNIVLLKVRAHTDKKDEHSKGNEIADKLANEGALYNDTKNIYKCDFNTELFDNDDSKNIYKNNFSTELFNNDDTKNIYKNNFSTEIFEKKLFKINKEIQMNELFEFEEGTESIFKNKQLKNQKLSNWFVKKN